MRLKPLKALRSLRLRAAIAAAIAVAGFAGLAIAQTTPALADPTVTLVAVGSDTIQDVYNQFSGDVSGNLLGSYNAVNPVTAVAHEVITPADGTAGVNCSFARPNGSGEGVGALRLSINPASTLGLAAPGAAAGSRLRRHRPLVERSGQQPVQHRSARLRPVRPGRRWRRDRPGQLHRDA